eukprot:tig00000741_g3842.t1
MSIDNPRTGLEWVASVFWFLQIACGCVFLIPQAMLNRKRQTTSGLSMVMIAIWLTGRCTSIMQLMYMRRFPWANAAGFYELFMTIFFMINCIFILRQYFIYDSSLSKGRIKLAPLYIVLSAACLSSGIYCLMIGVEFTDYEWVYPYVGLYPTVAVAAGYLIQLIVIMVLRNGSGVSRLGVSIDTVRTLCAVPQFTLYYYANIAMQYQGTVTSSFVAHAAALTFQVLVLLLTFAYRGREIRRKRRKDDREAGATQWAVRRRRRPLATIAPASSVPVGGAGPILPLTAAASLRAANPRAFTDVQGPRPPSPSHVQPLFRRVVSMGSVANAVAAGRSLVAGALANARTRISQVRRQPTIEVEESLPGAVQSKEKQSPQTDEERPDFVAGRAARGLIRDPSPARAPHSRSPSPPPAVRMTGVVVAPPEEEAPAAESVPEPGPSAAAARARPSGGLRASEARRPPPRGGPPEPGGAELEALPGSVADAPG